MHAVQPLRAEQRGRRPASVGRPLRADEVKRAVGLRLLREQDGQVIGAGLSVARYFVHLLDSYSIVGYLWPIWDDKKQTFADKILKTVVVRT